MMNESELTKFIDEAEQVWFNVCYADRKGPEININGYDFQVIDDKRFATPEKVKLYFAEYWDEALAKTMMCNLKVLSINGETAALLGDPPSLPCVVKSLRILESSEDTIKIRAVLSGEVERNRVIHYTLRKSEHDKRLRIVSRSGKKGDCRYEPCKCCFIY